MIQNKKRGDNKLSDYKEWDIDDEEFAEFDAFIENLAELQKEYFSEPRVHTINMKRLEQFQYALYQITKIIKGIDPDAKIDHTLNTAANIGNGSIDVKTSEIIVYDPKIFSEATKFANNFEIYPLNDGSIRMSMMFHGMFDDLSIGKGDKT